MTQVDKWVVEIEDRIERKIDGNREKQPSIFGEWKSWDDFGASFIPETQKWIFVACMTHYFGLNVHSYLVYMQENVDRAWSYYRRVDDKFRTPENTKRFIEHLLVYSCFLIFSMILLSNENSLIKCLSGEDIENIRDFIMEEPMGTRGYLLTMNYQIPWFVVQAIYKEFSNISNKLSATRIHEIAYLFCRNVQPAPLNLSDTLPEGGTFLEDDFKHLLHIFHWSRNPNKKYQMSSDSDSDSDSEPTKWIGRFHIPSATKLQLSQTVFKKDEGDSIDVSYSDSNKLCIVTCMACLPTGEMKLTPWHFFQYSIELYKSLLRFEQWYGDQCGFPFTSYVTCMASLIKTEEDVRVLRTRKISSCCRHFAVNHQKKKESEIIPNTSFDDKAVLHCVQELRSLIDDNLPMPKELVNLEEKVMAHHQRSCDRVIGEFKKRYCSNKWIIISVIAAILLFVFTLLQTVYGMLSYYNQ